MTTIHVEEGCKKYSWSFTISPKTISISTDHPHGLNLTLTAPDTTPFVYDYEYRNRIAYSAFQEEGLIETDAMELYVGSFDYTWRDREDEDEDETEYTEEDNCGYITIYWKNNSHMRVDIPFIVAKRLHELLIKACPN